MNHPLPHPLIAALGAISLAAWNDIAGICAAAAAIGYTLWRWRRDMRNETKKK